MAARLAALYPLTATGTISLLFPRLDSHHPHQGRVEPQHHPRTGQNMEGERRGGPHRPVRQLLRPQIHRPVKAFVPRLQRTRACRARRTVVSRPRHDGQLPFKNGAIPFINGQLPSKNGARPRGRDGNGGRGLETTRREHPPTGHSLLVTLLLIKYSGRKKPATTSYALRCGGPCHPCRACRASGCDGRPR